ncbi:hypothetical protein TRIATDRAFT_254849 [Trichoderma atroviride IMI 206040]|uniref:Uncharacterized protein n=1 Tax=Hypocrea atroviridis (strain ATCC 20476 / IMI 206040) TaxID=452589 RepID=G9NIF0_HYPAI|nr:uncharacterized protein TRIATDRAFT_254849 [Trichoderma atroviride IMI 206040]EHK49563.1 hypothetical protein TRIATDRAFT_254849 [Trichoderma atroviride IMI 206040]
MEKRAQCAWTPRPTLSKRLGRITAPMALQNSVQGHAEERHNVHFMLVREKRDV